MTMHRPAASLLVSLLLVCGGCNRMQHRDAARDRSEPAPARPAPINMTPTGADPEGRMAVVDERPSSRYLVTERPPARRGGPDRAPALTIDEVAADPQPATREGEALDRAREHRATGDIRAALAELERAIAFNPRFTPALLEAGDLHMEMGQIALAERSFATAARAEPLNFDAQSRHAAALRALGRTDEAVRAYLRALAIRPGEFDAMLGLSTAYLESDNPEQALPYATRSVEARPSSGEARMHLGNVYAALDRHEEAVVEFRQAAELMPKPAPGLLLNMAESFNRLGRYAEMVGALTEVVAGEPTPVAWERLGSGLFRLKRYEESLDAFANAVALDPTYAPALNGVAVCELNNYLWSGKSDGPARERAVEAMRASLRVDRNQPRIVELLRRYGQAAPEERVRIEP